jgi:hypothetical protein
MSAKKAIVIVCGVVVVTLYFFVSARAYPWCDSGPSGINRVKDAIFNETFVLLRPQNSTRKVQLAQESDCESIVVRLNCQDRNDSRSALLYLSCS